MELRASVTGLYNKIGWMRKGDKLDKHEKALQETQLVKIKNKETLEGKVDIQKVKEIRRAIRRRYGNRSNYHKIFNSWDRHRKGYIDITDVHYMINKLGININAQESKVLMASHDLSGNKKLTMDEFMDLIFSTDDNMNVDLSKIRFQTNMIEIEPNEDIMSGIQKDAAKLKKIKDESMLKYVLQKTLKDVYKEFKEQDKEKTDEIDYETFERAIINKAQLPSYIKENKELLASVFTDLDVKKTGKINYQAFCDGIKNFQYVGDSEVNADLGPGKPNEPLTTGRREADEKKLENRRCSLQDVQKVPENQLVKIVAKTLKVSRILQARFGSADKLDKELKEKLKFDKYGNVAALDLENYMLDVCKNHLVKREVDRADLEGFLSSFVYNKYKMTDVNNLAPMIFSDDTQISKKVYSLRRPMPPPAAISESMLNAAVLAGDETISNDRMRQVIKELQQKSFADKKNIYYIFREYDRDGDGYVSYDDVKEQFKKLQIPAKDAEVKKFIELADTKKQGYLDFRNFADVIRPNMVESLAPLPSDEETYLYKRDRLNLVPNAEKIREDIEYHKTFTNKFNEIKNQLVPDQNMLISITIL